MSSMIYLTPTHVIHIVDKFHYFCHLTVARYLLCFTLIIGFKLAVSINI